MKLSLCVSCCAVPSFVHSLNNVGKLCSWGGRENGRVWQETKIHFLFNFSINADCLGNGVCLCNSLTSRLIYPALTSSTKIVRKLDGRLMKSVRLLRCYICCVCKLSLAKTFFCKSQNITCTHTQTRHNSFVWHMG